MFLLLLAATAADAQENLNLSTYLPIPFNPPAFPLAVRSPYLNTWLYEGSNPRTPGFNFATYWSAHGGDVSAVPPGGTFVLGFAVTAQIDGKNWALIGLPQGGANFPNVTGSLMTPTRTVFSYSAGGMAFNLSFLSPVERGDLVQQSIPFSYFSVDMVTTDGNEHNVSVYADVDSRWIAGFDTTVMNWTSSSNDGIVFHAFSAQNSRPFQQDLEQSDDTTCYIAMLKGKGVTWKIGATNLTEIQFGSNGQLDNEIDTNFRNSVDGNLSPRFAIAITLGNITQTASSLVWAVGVVRDPSIQYQVSPSKIQLRRPYYVSQYGSPEALVTAVLNDYSGALDRATALDQQIASDASKFSSQYGDLLTMALRQIMAPMDITLGTKNDGSLDTGDVMVFVKNLGNVGGPGVNRVDALYVALPAYLYIDPVLLGYMLEPLFQYQEMPSLYPNPYAAVSLGAGYPNATGNSLPHNEGIETSASMLIMTLAQAQVTGNGTLIGAHYNILRTWAMYLVQQALAPGNQITSDGYPATNQTNLAIKGIIGVGAMAKISDAFGNLSDSQFFQNQTQNMVAQFLPLASGPNNLLSSYGDQGASGLMYNLYADVLLQTNIFPPTIYTQQAAFYAAQLSSSQFGLPVDSSNVSQARTDWTLLAAGAVADPVTRDLMVSQVHAYAAIGTNFDPLPVIYNLENGVQANGSASPAQGAMFSFLAVNQTAKPIKVPAESTGAGDRGGGNGAGRHRKHLSAGAIAGIVIAALLGVLVVGGVGFIIRRKSLRLVGRMSRRRDVPALDMIGETEMHHPYVNRDMQESVTSSSSGAALIPPSMYAYPSSSSYPVTESVTETFPSTTVTSPLHERENSKLSVVNDDLRLQMENLKREVDVLRERDREREEQHRMALLHFDDGVSEAPPDYMSGSGDSPTTGSEFR